MRPARAALLAALAPVAFAAVLAVEVQLARMGPESPAPPDGLDSLVGAEEGGPERSVVWLGNSTAAGVGVTSADEALPRLVAAAMEGPVRVTVLAESGARVADLLEHQAPKVAALRPDLVFVDVGANDTVHATSRRAFRDRYRRLLGTLPPGVPVLVLGVPDMGSPPRFAQPLRAVAGWRGRALDEVVRQEAARTGARYADIAGRTGGPFRRRPDHYFSRDRYHPDGDGYRLWADAVLDALGAAP